MDGSSESNVTNVALQGWEQPKWHHKGLSLKCGYRILLVLWFGACRREVVVIRMLIFCDLYKSALQCLKRVAR